MRLPEWLTDWLRLKACGVMMRRGPDLTIGGGVGGDGGGGAYLERWYLLPRNRLLNLYLHRVLRSDDDRALHDHPWINLSILLQGGYREVLPARGEAPNSGRTRRIWRGEGDLVLRRARAAHRLEIPLGGFAMTLFITGPRLRTWGFWCPEDSPAGREARRNRNGRGWRRWQDFTDASGRGIGRGCGE